jgi:hypothetical protein
MIKSIELTTLNANKYINKRLRVQSSNIRAWWEEEAAKIPRQRRRHFNGVVIYTMWNIWKERNIRIFQNLVMDAQQVASKTKEDIDLRSRFFNNLT